MLFVRLQVGVSKQWHGWEIITYCLKVRPWDIIYVFNMRAVRAVIERRELRGDVREKGVRPGRLTAAAHRLLLLGFGAAARRQFLLAAPDFGL